MSVEVRHLRALVAVADVGSFSGAADELGVSQPVVTRRVQQLEGILGQQLVERTTRAVTMSEKGRCFVSDARVVLATLDAALEKATGHGGSLRLGFQWAPPSRWLSAVTESFRAATGRDVDLVRSDDVESALVDGGLDAALSRISLAHPHLEQIQLADEARVAVMNADHPFTRRDHVTWEELGRQTLVVNTVNGTTTPDLWPEDSRPTDVVTCQNFDEWTELVVAGRGMGSLPVSALTHRLHPALRVVPLRGAPPCPLYLAYPTWKASAIRELIHASQCHPLTTS